jgi:hypothetical protein
MGEFAMKHVPVLVIPSAVFLFEGLAFPRGISNQAAGLFP